jgi:NAD(P)H-hydrate repair Nnr-like enzyme with NAD(P)H-hydrate dehydratase domain
MLIQIHYFINVIIRYKATTVLERGWLADCMAQASSGDVLASTIGALMAMGNSADQATLLGVYLHAWSADRYAAKHGI